MYRKIGFVAVMCLLVFTGIALAADEAKKEGFSKDKVIAIATAKVRAAGFNLEEVQIIYDENNQLWDRQIGKMTGLDKSPNFGIFKKGFMKNYITVYFDFKEPMPDLWVFIDKDTGEVLDIYKIK